MPVTLSLSALAASAVVGCYAFWVVPRRLVVLRHRLALPAWPPTLRPLRVAVLSDLHACGPHMTARRIQDIARAVVAEGPDLVVLLGDFVATHHCHTGRPSLAAMADALALLRAPLGVAAVLGNHDLKREPGVVRRALEAAGIRVLEDEAMRLEHDGRAIWLAGLADPFGRRPNVTSALAAVEDGEPVLLLTHSPDAFPQVPARVALTLAGHTHGGQVSLPGLGPLFTCSAHGPRYVRGHVVEDGRHLFVTSGLGTSLLPCRLGVPPEIALLTLEPVAT